MKGEYPVDDPEFKKRFKSYLRDTEKLYQKFLELVEDFPEAVNWHTSGGSDIHPAHLLFRIEDKKAKGKEEDGSLHYFGSVYRFRKAKEK